ncbi:MAG: hypothetical protein Q8S10_08135 [Thiobacillus sp.]|nr:hypothetical protein [Thiobacillus sp.]
MAVLIEWRTASHPELKAGLRIDGQDAPVACHDGRAALHPATYQSRHFPQYRLTHLTVSNSNFRFLMLWFFVALQTMAPFIHAHAGAVQLNHSGFLHVHQGVHGDAAWHVVAGDEHGAEVEVAQGMPVRSDTPAMTAAPAPLAASLPLPHAAAAACLGAGLPAPPPLHLALPDHTLPHALAPPLA